MNSQRNRLKINLKHPSNVSKQIGGYEGQSVMTPISHTTN